MLTGLKIAADIILFLCLAITANFAFSLINAPNDMSVVAGIGILLSILVVLVTVETYAQKKIVKWFKIMAATRAAKKENEHD